VFFCQVAFAGDDQSLCWYGFSILGNFSSRENTIAFTNVAERNGNGVL
jgi:hypothetical protein